MKQTAAGLNISNPHTTGTIRADESYRSAARKATDYFRSLHQQVVHKTYVEALTTDIQSWKRGHTGRFSLLYSFFGHGRRPDPKDYTRYIRWLRESGKLGSFLDRSVSYIFLRDLGKTLDSSDTQARIQRAVDVLRDYLTRQAASGVSDKPAFMNMALVYRRAEKEGIESSVIWAMEKLKAVSNHIPQGIDAEHAERKIIKIIAGLLMHGLEEGSVDTSPEERTRKLDIAIRLGYSYGLTYPFVDDVLDADILSPEEQERYSDLIRTALITGCVPALGHWTGKNGGLVRYVHSELKTAFEYVKSQQRPEDLGLFFEQAYVFFHAQEVDRKKELSDPRYTNEELYVPVILKSSLSRLIARLILGQARDSEFEERTFFYGVYNQLADDFADMFEDVKRNAVTPFTYYMRHRDQRHDLVNPFELYWIVIFNLIHNVYKSDPKASEVILSRAFNGLKRFKARMGPEKYRQFAEIFACRNPKLDHLIDKMARKADEVDFLDKLVRDWLYRSLSTRKAEKEAFKETVKSVSKEINGILNVPKAGGTDPLLDQTIIDAANYSLEAGGKRLRPLLAWIVGVDWFELKPKAIAPLIRSLEYMHTASLIFDDLPSQDNADTRRGRSSLHVVYGHAIAELTGIFLIQKAVEEQASLLRFDPRVVLKLIRYAAGATENVCKGQAMDLVSKGKQLTLEHLKTVCFHKTGLAFEACFVMPAILAQAREAEIETLKKLAFHVGIAFQIRDDLLDAEGNPAVLGKRTGRDAENQNSTFVTVLGLEGARKELWSQYCQAMEAMTAVPYGTAFLKQLLNYVVGRDN